MSAEERTGFAVQERGGLRFSADVEIARLNVAILDEAGVPVGDPERQRPVLEAIVKRLGEWLAHQRR